MAAKHERRLALAEEVIDAKQISISTPIWNFSVPALSSFIDNKNASVSAAKEAAQIRGAA